MHKFKTLELRRMYLQTYLLITQFYLFDTDILLIELQEIPIDLCVE